MVESDLPINEEMSVQDERAKYGEDKPKSKDTARLIWASKPKKEPNAKDLEFQTAEEVYPNIAEVRDRKLTSFMVEKKEISDNPNRLIWGDNLLVMQALLAQGYEGQIDLIYIDPPFNTGENFNFSTKIAIGDSEFEKELTINERLAYTDIWDRGVDSFLDMLYPRLLLMRRLLSDKGVIFVHIDYHMSHYVKIILDEIFNQNNFINEIIWKRKGGSANPSNRFGIVTDSIFFYSKTKSYLFNPSYSKDSSEVKRYIEERFNQKDEKGVFMVAPIERNAALGIRKNLIFEYKGYTPKYGWMVNKEKLELMDSEGRLFWNKNNRPNRKVYLEDYKGQPIENLWTDIFVINPMALERLNFDTQKPEALLKRILETSTIESDLVADFFCGSGTTASVSEKLGRRWITSDLSKTAIQVTRGRLVNETAQPFLIENLGNYQRQLIYAKEVKLKEMYNIILKLYGATPREDWQGFGISKEDKNTLVFVCEPDRPMTGKKAVDLAKTTKTADGKGYRRLIILAWDYDYDFDDTFSKLAKALRARNQLSDVEFKIIPSDVYKYLRSTKVGDPELAKKITFYQKPYIRLSEPQVMERKEDEIRVKISIEQYVVMDIPIKDETKRPEIEQMLHKNFAYLIDYWTVDWNYNGEVFRSRWQAIRDRKSPESVPTIAHTTLKKGKKYTIAVRVVDVFGNDAAMTKEIDLR